MDSKINFILPKGIGGFEMRDNIDKNIIIKLLQQFNRG
jgi:3-dehydroquinate synthetase